MTERGVISSHVLSPSALLRVNSREGTARNLDLSRVFEMTPDVRLPRQLAYRLTDLSAEVSQRDLFIF